MLERAVQQVVELKLWTSPLVFFANDMEAFISSRAGESRPIGVLSWKDAPRACSFFRDPRPLTPKTYGHSTAVECLRMRSETRLGKNIRILEYKSFQSTLISACGKGYGSRILTLLAQTWFGAYWYMQTLDTQRSGVVSLTYNS